MQTDSDFIINIEDECQDPLVQGVTVYAEVVPNLLFVPLDTTGTVITNKNDVVTL